MKDKNTVAFLIEMRKKNNEEWLSILENHSLAESFGKEHPLRNAVLETIHTWFCEDSIVKSCLELNEIIERKAKELEV